MKEAECVCETDICGKIEIERRIGKDFRKGIFYEKDKRRLIKENIL